MHSSGEHKRPASRAFRLHGDGGDMDQRAIIEKARKDLAFLQGDVLGVLFYGSWATGENHENSDIDICIVALSVEDKAALWRSAIAVVRDDCYDIRIFQLMPLYLQMAVIELGVVSAPGTSSNSMSTFTYSAAFGGTRSTARS